MPATKRYVRTSSCSRPTIDSIEMAEFEKHSDLKEWLGKRTPEFIR